MLLDRTGKYVTFDPLDWGRLTLGIGWLEAEDERMSKTTLTLIKSLETEDAIPEPAEKIDEYVDIRELINSLRFDPYLIDEPALTIDDIQRARVNHPSSRGF